MPIDSDPSFWKWVSGGVLGAVSGGFGYHKYMESKIAKKADQEEVRRCLGHIEKLYENAEKDRRTVHECVDKLGDQIHSNHIEVIRELSGKVDR